MDAVKFFKEKERLCKSHDDVNCNKCELHNICDVAEKAEEVVAIVEKWSAEHTVKTYAMDFFEKFPNASSKENTLRLVCRDKLYKGVREICTGDCSACWNEPMEETK